MVAKACICHDLAGGATLKYGIDPSATPTVCCGPNIVNFSNVVSLREMIDHIYGRLFLITNPGRKHMFIQELLLNAALFRKEMEKAQLGIFGITADYLQEFQRNMSDGINYYGTLDLHLSEKMRAEFLEDLNKIKEEIQASGKDRAAAHSM